MTKNIKDTIKHSAIALIVGVILGLLINYSRTNPNDSFQVARFGVVICLMLTLNYIRNWKLKYVGTKVPAWLDYLKSNWLFETIHFLAVNLSFIIPLILFKSF